MIPFNSIASFVGQPNPFVKSWIKKTHPPIYVPTDRLDYYSNKLVLDKYGELWSGDPIGTGSYELWGTIYHYSIFKTEPIPPWTTYSWGVNHPFNVTPRIVVTAQHYPAWDKNRTWPSGGHLMSWAQQSGLFTTKYINSIASFTDIHVALKDKATCAQEKCPYLMSPETQSKLFSKYSSFKGVLGWKAPLDRFIDPDTKANCTNPVLFTSNSTWSRPHDAYSNIFERNEPMIQLKNICKNMPQTYLAYVGDSGKPVWINMPTNDGRVVNVLVSHNRGVGDGPDYTLAFDVWKAFAESQGETINEYTIDMAPKELLEFD